jgi:photosystem II stability/assembly factor-like uncharacterized protein
VYFLCDQDLVFSTEDTGHSFISYPQYAPTNNSAGGLTLQSIAFADSMVGYIADGAHGEFRTTDGGQTWKQMANPGANVNLVAFGSSTVGWKVGGGGFYKTTDAGQSWFIIWGLYGWFSKMCILNGQDLWLLNASQGDSAHPATLWRSPDGGWTWRAISTGMIGQHDYEIQYQDFVMRPSGVGCITGTDYSQGFVLTTTDFGVTWKRQYFGDEFYSNVICFSDSTWLLLGLTGGLAAIRRTTDMGQTWTHSQAFGSDTLQNQGFYCSAYVPQLNTVLATTTYGSYRSTDQGKTFSKLTSDRDQLVGYVTTDKAATSPSDQTIICPSYSLDYIISRDGGSHWTHKLLPGYGPDGIGDVKVSGGLMFQIVYEGDSYYRYASLQRSLDFGDHWTICYVPPYGGGLRALSTSRPGVVAMQGYAYIHMSMDSGKTWSHGPISSDFWMNTMQVLGQGKIIGVGGYYKDNSERGIVYVSTDKGMDWRVQDFPVDMKQLVMTTEWSGCALSANGELYHTNDGARTWSLAATWVWSFAFYDSLRGLRSDLQMTTDGGVTWTPSGIPLTSTQNFTSMEFNKAGDLFAAGYGNLFKYTNAISVIPLSATLAQGGSANPAASLGQNSPNPFNPVTSISYKLSRATTVTLKVFDLLGQELATLVNERREPGTYTVQFDASKLSSGIYFYRMVAGELVQTKKMMVVK